MQLSLVEHALASETISKTAAEAKADRRDHWTLCMPRNIMLLGERYRHVQRNALTAAVPGWRSWAFCTTLSRRSPVSPTSTSTLAGNHKQSGGITRKKYRPSEGIKGIAGVYKRHIGMYRTPGHLVYRALEDGVPNDATSYNSGPW